MFRVRRSEERGRSNQDWLEARYTFSFADYHDPDHMGFRALRVMNEDRIAPGRGFGPHAHRDMEIVTYVLEGAIRHSDSMGQEGVIGPDEIQAMSAGSGVVHSEFNASLTDPLHLIQIWIEPSSEDLKPSYQQIRVSPEERRGRLRLLAGPGEGEGEARTRLHQDAWIYAGELGEGESVTVGLEPGRHAWIQVVRGSVTVNGEPLDSGDGVAVSDESELTISGSGKMNGEILLFDLA